MTTRKITDFFQPTNSNIKTYPNIEVFTDGSCINNGKKNLRQFAGYAAVFPEDMTFTVYEPLKGHEKTNNRAEFMALIRALEIADEIDESKKRGLLVYSDSELLCNTVSLWMSSWKRRGWKKKDDKPVANLDLVKRLDELKQLRKVIMVHVRAHTTNNDYQSKWNRVADELAKKAAFEPLPK